MMIANLVETTSARQAKNGAHQFYDEITGHSYATYKSGYVRRILGYISSETGNVVNYDMYPLNKRLKDTRDYILVHCEKERMEMMIRFINLSRSKKK